MFGFKSLVTILAAAATVVTALPTGSSSDLARRVAEPAALPVAVPETRAVATIDVAITTCTNALVDIYADIDAAVAAKADVTVFIGLWTKVVAVIVDLQADIQAFVGVKVDAGILGLSVTAIVDAYVDIFVALVAKLQATVAVIAVTDLTLFVDVFLKLVAAIVANVNLFVKVCAQVVILGISIDAQVVALLNVKLVAFVNALVALCETLKVDASVIASVKALIALKVTVGINL